jgi:hypothetical protein
MNGLEILYKTFPYEFYSHQLTTDTSNATNRRRTPLPPCCLLDSPVQQGPGLFHLPNFPFHFLSFPFLRRNEISHINSTRQTIPPYETHNGDPKFNIQRAAYIQIARIQLDLNLQEKVGTYSVLTALLLWLLGSASFVSLFIQRAVKKI